MFKLICRQHLAVVHNSQSTPHFTIQTVDVLIAVAWCHRSNLTPDSLNMLATCSPIRSDYYSESMVFVFEAEQYVRMPIAGPPHRIHFNLYLYTLTTFAGVCVCLRCFECYHMWMNTYIKITCRRDSHVYLWIPFGVYVNSIVRVAFIGFIGIGTVRLGVFISRVCVCLGRTDKHANIVELCRRSSNESIAFNLLLLDSGHQCQERTKPNRRYNK